MKRRFSMLMGMAIMAANMVSSAGAADVFPARPVTLILPQDAAGLDTEMRLLTQKILDGSGVRMVVDKRPGAAGTIASTYVAKATPDGHTILVQNSGFAITPFVYPSLPFDYAKDFAPVTLLTKRAFLIVVHPSAPFKDVSSYVAYARSHPGEINFGTSGIGSSTHLPGAMLHHMTGTKATFIHYKTSQERLTDVIAGRTHAAAVTVAGGMPQVRAGKLHPLGVTTDKRVAVAPDLRTFAEQGVKGYDNSSWTGILAPARTPAPVIARLNEIWVKAIKDPDLAKQAGFDGALMVGSTPEEFRKFFMEEAGRFQALIKATGITIDAN